MTWIMPLDAGAIEAMGDQEIEGYFREAHRTDTPPPHWLALLALQPGCLKAWARFWWATFRGGVVDHALKELLRVHIARLLRCEH